MSIMESSRIFVRGLPPTLTEEAFRSHFELKDGHITDIKLIGPRRIGYVGYQSPEEARRAVKHFNRSFIRMSKVGVELAKPIADPSLVKPKPFSRDAVSAASGSKLARPSPVGDKTDATKKRKRDDLDRSDPKLKEFLGVMQSSTQGANRIHGNELQMPEEPTAQMEALAVPEEESDDEYETIPSKRNEAQVRDHKRPKPSPNDQDTVMGDAPLQNGEDANAEPANPEAPESADQPPSAGDAAATDDDWLRSRTNRLLDLVDDPEDLAPPADASKPSQPLAKSPTPITAEEKNLDTLEEDVPQSTSADEGPEKGSAEVEQKDDALESVRKTKRLFIRNLAYSAAEDDLKEYFEQFGAVEEVHMPADKSGKKTGFAYVLFVDADAAVGAFQNSGAYFQGRLLHILPASAKRDHNLDEYELSKLPLKQQTLLRKKAKAASDRFNWNSLFMSQDAVNTSVSDRLGITKSELLDPHSSDAAVKQAIAETNTIQETKSYFAANGVDLDAFKSSARGDTAILVKNFNYGTTVEELRSLFEEHGQVLRVLMPPTGTIAIVQFAQAPAAKTAFSKLAYRRFKNSMLYLEKAPKNLFVGGGQPIQNPAPQTVASSGVQKLSVSELLDQDSSQNAPAETGSLYVRNLSFNTTTEQLTKAFEHLEGFRSAQVKTKTDSKRGVLSMGYGFVHFADKKAAEAAVPVMEGFVLQGHKLQVKQSHRGHDAAEERRREDDAKKAATGTKIIVKNLAWEATKKDIRTLFGNYGQLRSVRVPKKFNKGSRGFAFCEFASARDAQTAVNALRDTHYLGRKLVLEYAEADTLDAEEEIAKMQQKVGRQMNTVALQQLTGGGRKKVKIGDQDEDAEGDI